MNSVRAVMNFTEWIAATLGAQILSVNMTAIATSIAHVNLMVKRSCFNWKIERYLQWLLGHANVDCKHYFCFNGYCCVEFLASRRMCKYGYSNV